jgi:hypothetical protein
MNLISDVPKKTTARKIRLKKTYTVPYIVPLNASISASVKFSNGKVSVLATNSRDLR